MNNKYINLIESFKKIDTEAKAYFLGLLYADGYNLSKYNTVGITLHNQDLDILKKIKNTFKIEQKIYNIKSRNHSRLTLANKELSHIFYNYGVVDKKSYIIKFPREDQVPNHLLPHFIRGYFDGDGSIWKRKNRPKDIGMTICGGGKDLIEGIYNFFTKNEIKCKIRIKTKGYTQDFYYLDFHSNPPILLALKLMYKDATIYLDRKYNKYIEYLDYYNNITLLSKSGPKIKKRNWPKKIFCALDLAKLNNISRPHAQFEITRALKNDKIEYIKNKSYTKYYLLKEVTDVI